MACICAADSSIIVFLTADSSLGLAMCAHPSISCRVPLVVFQEPSEAFTTPHRTCVRFVLVDGRKEQHVALPLMIALVMKVCHILRQRMAERRFPKENEPRQALLLDGAYPPLRVGVEVRRPWRQRHPCHFCGIDDL